MYLSNFQLFNNIVFRYFYVHSRPYIVRLFFLFFFVYVLYKSCVICKHLNIHIYVHVFLNRASKDIMCSSSSCFSTRKRKGVDDANYVIIAMYTAVETTILILLITMTITE